MSKETMNPIADASRRDFLRLGTMAAAALSVTDLYAAAPATHAETMIGVPFKAGNPRIGIIGVGGRGTNLLENLLAADAQIHAICDIVKEKAEHAQGLVTKAGQKAPELYTDGDHAFEKLVARDDLDLVIAATPWNWHVEMAVAAMKHGKHAAVEVPAALTIEDCWKMVDTSEATRKHCMMLENCCYGYNETLILRMTHAGLFGDLLYGEGAYLHDLRGELFSNKGEGLWRRTFHTTGNGNLYPTHGLGPVANYMGIQRGDRFESMVSMSSPQRGLELYRKEHVEASDPRWKEKYIEGDMNVSLIKTAKGLTITVKHDTSNPRPYSRVNMIAGKRESLRTIRRGSILTGRKARKTGRALTRTRSISIRCGSARARLRRS
ncbi:MAG TPA: Gfo/Idh/MocA family oxidoreductase, partial [Acidobacteriaceae bacterium]|nr:Gfo/Idh/MocA family oxidoreductase [Acidobacteriaceae bacterium]